MLFFRKLIKLPSQLIEMRYHHANLHLIKPDFARIQPSLFRIHSAFVRYTVFYLQVPNDKDFPIPDEETQATDNEPTTRIMEKEQVPNDKDFPIPDEETQATDNERYLLLQTQIFGIMFDRRILQKIQVLNQMIFIRSSQRES